MKKLIAILLSLVMVFAFCACGEKSETPQTESQPATTQTTPKTLKEELQNVINGEFETPKNVIIIIGDGMAPNDLILAEKNNDQVYDFGLVLNLIKNHGLATTHSADSETTDSAAAATALSTGTKTNNGSISIDPEGNDLKTMAELAREAGKKVGIITDDEISGATPTAFTVHNKSRDNKKELVNAMINFKPDVLMGKDYNSVFPLLDGQAQKLFYGEYLVARDFNSFKDTLDKDPDGQKPFLGFLNGYSPVASDNLAQGVDVALNRLKNDNGFFLMIEGCGTDKFGQNNNINGKLASVVTLDRTVETVLKFMKENPDTLLVITSDHETGGVKIPSAEESLSDALTTKEHTATPVRVFAVGKGSEYFKDKTVDNTEIAKFLIEAIKGK